MLPCQLSLGQQDAHQILEKSIQFHDAEKKLLNKKVTFHFTETRPGGDVRKSRAITWPKKEYFLVQRISDGISTTMISDRGALKFLLNGKDNFTGEEAEKYRLNEERLQTMTSYYRYLWHLPLTLLDPGTIVHDQVREVGFFGSASLEIKVSYEPEIGGDTWYFYFRPDTFEMVGYRFYHDESKNDGEYILVDQLVETEGIKIPKTRKWYTHQDNRFLGEDTLESIQIE